MPDDNADLAAVEAEFERLVEDSATSCPVAIGDLLSYLVREVPCDWIAAVDLTFRRTADVDGTRYWIWSFVEPDGDEAYATISVSPAETATVGYDTNYYGLSPEQYILGDYHQVF